MYLQVTRGNAWYKSPKQKMSFLNGKKCIITFFGWEVLTLLYSEHLLIIMCNYLTLLRPKQTFRPGHTARDYSNIYQQLEMRK